VIFEIVKKMKFLNFGYYIVEPMPTPEYVGLKCGRILTATDCICNLHPSLSDTFGINSKQEQSKYQKMLGLSEEMFGELKDTVSRLFDMCKIDFDSRFACLSDALDLTKKYLYNLSEIKIISIALENEFKDIFLEDVAEDLKIPAFSDERKNDGVFLGFDILGYDQCSFHSYLCNGLSKDIANRYHLEINDYGLIQNPYSQVKEFAEYIQGKGEPVDWLPFAVYGHQIE
jgi:hypothetical protein